MFKTLEPLHTMLERGPQTLKEVSFNQTYGRDLTEAQDWCNRFKVNPKKTFNYLLKTCIFMFFSSIYKIR